MANSRRNFIKKSGLAGMAGLSFPVAGMANSKINPMKNFKNKRPKILFFDVNETLLDLTIMKESVGKALNGKEELLPLWFTTMLQNSLVETVGNHYEDFGEIGAASLVMVAANNDIQMSLEEAKEAISPIKSLPPHPEVKEALGKLKEDGYRLISLTNSSNAAVEKQFTNAGLLDFFEERLSIEDVGKYKPHVDTYNWASRKMGVKPEEAMLIAAHGWDVAGALWAGWRAAFVSRPGQQQYPLAPEPEIAAPDLKIISEKLIALEK
ncbi:haloacid dehalogenase type II [Gillisia limnaea]|uniref:Haloacid dehalogenase, type II n=1 Tax=Gillisia limnaea (strain DSM 15749 / LMG 21470 / R-8282) TaxID=865937 RepID=H2BSW7_GILLR|nr:haloacid dehalogenase type II [Gillisia limnaea]EHQ01497.1 haloacid dehalogenase, type II [Gillisia limnaea DSM 15749]